MSAPEAPVNPARDDWHAIAAAEALARLGTGADGLSAGEAATRLAADGPNALEAAKGRSLLMRVRGQFDNLLVLSLLAAAAVMLAIGEPVDAAIIFGVVAINAAIGVYQEGRSEEALAAIRAMLAPSARVRRAGRVETVPAETLVAGDIVKLAPGDKVPADMRLIEANDLEVQEAALTGESFPVEKGTRPVAPDAPLAERRAMVYAGTLVAAGTALGLVVATGSRTEIGRIGRAVAAVETPTTPLIQQIGIFARWVTGAIALASLAMILFGVFVRGYTLEEMFLAAVAFAVAVVPEGLPAIMTITLAAGVTRMAARNAIVRRLPAVETLGAVTHVFSSPTRPAR